MHFPFVDAAYVFDADGKEDWHNDGDVLQVLQLNLARAEEARRKSDSLLACNSYFQLAAFFEAAGDKPTASWFYAAALRAVEATEANYAKKAEIHAQIALLAESQGLWKSS